MTAPNTSKIAAIAVTLLMNTELILGFIRKLKRVEARALERGVDTALKPTREQVVNQMHREV